MHIAWASVVAVEVVAAAVQTVPMRMNRVDKPPHSRILQLNGNGHTIPADGAVFPTAMYYAMLQIGTPPQDFAVGLDSGSGDLFVEGKGCNGCTHSPINNAYDPDSSSTSKRAFPGFFIHSYKTCNMKNPSASCQISGTSFTDQVSLAGLGPVQIKFGAIQSQSNNFDTKRVVGGLMGIHDGETGQDVFATLVGAGKCENIWAMCMHEGSVSNGTLSVGGVDSRLSSGSIEYVKDQATFAHGVHVTSLKVGNKKVTINQNAVLDSGTNVLLLPSALYPDVKSSMCADSSLLNCEKLWSNQCVELTAAQVDHYPSLILQLDGTALTMTSREYLLLNSPLAATGRQYCLGIRDGGEAGFILGATTMKNYYVVFDFAQKRIGWGNVNKQSCGSITADGMIDGAISV